jgi:hypothetical protein
MKNKNLFSLAAAGLMLAVGLQFSGCKKGEEDPFLSLRSRKARITGEWTVTAATESYTYSTVYDNDPLVDNELVMRDGSSTSNFDGTGFNIMETWTNTYDGTGFNDESTYELNASGSAFEESYTTRYTDNTSFTSTEEGDYSSGGSMTYTFNSDGTFTASQTRTRAYSNSETDAGYDYTYTSTETEEMTISGTWSFIDGNKSDEFEDKERIALWYKSGTSVYATEVERDYTDTDASDFWNYNLWDETTSESSNDEFTASDTDPDETWEIVMLKNNTIEAKRSYTYSGTGSYTSEDSYYSGSTWVTDSYESSSDYTETGTATMTLEQL